MSTSPADGAGWEQPPEGRRRRWLVPTLVVVTLLAGALVWSTTRAQRPDTLAVAPTAAPTSETATTPPGPTGGGGEQLEPLVFESATPSAALLPGAPDLTVVAADSRGLRFIDVPSGTIRRVELPQGPAPVPRPRTMFSVGDNLIVSDGSRVVRMDADGGNPTRVATSGEALVTYDDDSVWVVQPFTTGRAGTAVQMRLDGTVIERLRFPAVARPAAGTADGLVVSTPGGISLASGDRARALTPTGTPAAIDAERIAWTDCTPELRCELVIGTLDDPNGVRLPIDREELPAGFFDLPRGVFSPDGRLLALPVFEVNARGGLRNPAVAIIDTAVGVEVARAPGARVDAIRASAVAWSPDGRWLFISTGTGLRAWNADSGQITDLEIGAGIVRELVVR